MVKPSADTSAPIVASDTSIVVRPTGQFVAVEDITALKAVVDALFASVNSEVAQARGLKELLAAVTSEQFLASLSAQDWSALVATWVDLPLEPTKRSVETEEFSPAFPGIAMPLKTTIGMVSRSPGSSRSQRSREPDRRPRSARRSIERADPTVSIRVMARTT